MKTESSDNTTPATTSERSRVGGGLAHAIARVFGRPGLVLSTGPDRGRDRACSSKACAHHGRTRSVRRIRRGREHRFRDGWSSTTSPERLDAVRRGCLPYVKPGWRGCPRIAAWSGTEDVDRSTITRAARAKETSDSKIITETAAADTRHHHRTDHDVTAPTNARPDNRAGDSHTRYIGNTKDGIIGRFNDGQQPTFLKSGGG